MVAQQADLQFGPVRNSGLFSNHWLANRLTRQPEWDEFAGEATAVLHELADLWKVQKRRVENYGDEQGLEEAFIQPVFRTLGWKIKYQTFLQGRQPDYALFLDDPALDAALQLGRNDPRFWECPASLADAKAWHVNLDRPTRVGSRREYPPEQIEWYLDRSRLDFAILTNGKLWRLIPREYEQHQRRFETYLEIDLAKLLSDWSGAQDIAEKSHLAEEFRHFFYFFGPVGYREKKERKPLIRRAVEGSSE